VEGGKLKVKSGNLECRERLVFCSAVFLQIQPDSWFVSG